MNGVEAKRHDAASADLRTRLTTRQIAAHMGVSVRSIELARRLLASGRDDIVAKVEAGEMSLHKALSIACPRNAGRLQPDAAASLTIKAVRKFALRLQVDDIEAFATALIEYANSLRGGVRQ